MKRGFRVGGDGIGRGNGSVGLGLSGAPSRKRKRNTAGACSALLYGLRVATSGSDSLAERGVGVIYSYSVSYHIVGDWGSTSVLGASWTSAFSRRFFAVDHSPQRKGIDSTRCGAGQVELQNQLFDAVPFFGRVWFPPPGHIQLLGANSRRLVN